MKQGSNTPNVNQAQQSGFTLMEMIGVMAVIAVLSAAAAPPIFEAIEDSKVSAYLQEVKTLELAVARYYKDTGKWPRHRPTSSTIQYHNLMVNDTDGKGTKIIGWKGPYLKKELTNHIVKDGLQEVQVRYSTDTDYVCDLDGNGTLDGSFLVYQASGISDKIALKISDIIDGDGDITTGSGHWKSAGRVRRQGDVNSGSSMLLYCITQV